MKIVFYGDSITDMCRENKDLEKENSSIYSYGSGYVFYVAGDLKRENPSISVINRGVSGNRIVDLYARVKGAVWNYTPDILSILVGVNDIWHELAHKNGVDIKRFEKIYRMLIQDTLKELPNVKIVLVEPFILKGSLTVGHWDEFLQVKEYAKVVKKLAKEFNLGFVPMQEKFDIASEKFGVEHYLYDGIHPNVAGARLIADAWIEYYNQNFKNL